MEDEDFVEPVYTEKEKQVMRAQRIMLIQKHYGCTQEDAVKFIDLRIEGHDVFRAAVLAGISDPSV